jgi:acetate kinase
LLVVNAGSTSLKLRVVDPDDKISASQDMGRPLDVEPGEIEPFLQSAGRVDAVGHRIVHGGSRFVSPVVVDPTIRAELDRLNELAPLHNPPALHALDMIHALRPALPTVACFDTMFHAGLPDEASCYALPTDWVERWGIRRYGFHGLSCEWALERTGAMMARDPAALRVVVCHLGGGASVTAVAEGRSVDTTMGFTPTEGLIMATRPGDVDPGLIAWLLNNGLSVAELTDALEHSSGLFALSGTRSGDMRVLLDWRRQGDHEAGGAIAAYLHRLRGKIAGMAAAANGIDVLVFTGGVGEHSAEIRKEASDGLGWLGVRLADDANFAVTDSDCEISGPGAAVRTLVVHSREEVIVARHCRQLLG